MGAREGVLDAVARPATVAPLGHPQGIKAIPQPEVVPELLLGQRRPVQEVGHGREPSSRQHAQFQEVLLLPPARGHPRLDHRHLLLFLPHPRRQAPRTNTRLVIDVRQGRAVDQRLHEQPAALARRGLAPLSRPRRVRDAHPGALHAESQQLPERVVDPTLLFAEEGRKELLSDGRLDRSHPVSGPRHHPLEVLPFALQRHGQPRVGRLRGQFVRMKIR